MKQYYQTNNKKGKVYTPLHIVNMMLDLGNYTNTTILKKNVIDNSCGNGAFLTQIVQRYCTTFLTKNKNLSQLKRELEIYIHGIEIDPIACEICKENLNQIAKTYGIFNVCWDIQNTDTLQTNTYEGKMDFIFGNPPYIRIHHLAEQYQYIKKFTFTQEGMTDLFIVFFEIGFKMLNKYGMMCLITPNSYLTSKAGKILRNYITKKQNLLTLIDLAHYQPFPNITTYTLISCFSSIHNNVNVNYFTYDSNQSTKDYKARLSLKDICITDKWYLGTHSELSILQKIRCTNVPRYVCVKNGFATLADSIFIGNFSFKKNIIPILKASTGAYLQCIFPYDKTGQPLPIESIKTETSLYRYLMQHKHKLLQGRTIKNKNHWYLFGRTQAIKDVYKNKIAINIVIKNIDSIKLKAVPKGEGVYSGLYILTDINFETIKNIILSETFIKYLKILKHYKSGGYYTYTSKDLELYLNYQLSKKL